MTRAPVTIAAVGRRDTAVKGKAVYTALAELNIPHMRPRIRSGDVWLIPSSRTEDLMAWCDHHKIPVTVTL